jgi:beta-glucosidase/6-phospho-beta-glucosidase/beta-galactosidase
MRKLLNHVWKTYAQPAGQVIRIFENGFAIDGEENLSFEEAKNDLLRQEFFNEHIRAMCDAVIDDGVDIRMYLAWSLLE